MDSLPWIRSEPEGLPEGCIRFSPSGSVKEWSALDPWRDPKQGMDLLLLLTATRTAEQEGISAAGATVISRRITALADAELVIRGPNPARRWSLPPLPAGVSPALLSHVASCHLNLSPTIAALGLPIAPDFPHLRLEPSDLGPAECVSSGAAMPESRVSRLWKQGVRIGARLQRPLVLAECVPGGTTTAQAVLTALGFSVEDLISGSARRPPQQLKRTLVDTGLRRAQLGQAPTAKVVLSAFGDPFQAVASGCLVGAVRSGQPLLLGGGSQMLAVLALAMQDLPLPLRSRLGDQVLIGTTAWLAQEGIRGGSAALSRLVRIISDHFDVSVMGIASGVRFHTSSHPALRDYERGFVKEGVGAGALLLLAQLRGIGCQRLVADCDNAFERLRDLPVTSNS